ncbi:MAG TPA: MEDS domain-containing protein [Marmoricola sp.]|nr:MEDS domain-containing protein [Marmoricola sp.]
MTGVRTVGSWSGRKLAHEAFVYDDDRAVRERCVPFVQEALDRDEAVVVVAGAHVRGLLEEEFGDRCARFAVFEAAEKAWAGGGQTLAAYRKAMKPLHATGRPWRLIEEPLWLSLPGGERWSRFEAVANEMFADYRYYSLCLHDRRQLAPALIADQLRTHPFVWDGTSPVENPDYVGTDRFLRSVEPAWTPAPSRAARVVITDLLRALPDLKSAVETSSCGRRDDLELAVYELVTNALKAAGTAEVRHWRDDGAEVWEVADAGPGFHDAAAGYRPPSENLLGSRGLWIARSLADEATVRPHGPGTAVRLWFRLHEAARPQDADRREMGHSRDGHG